MVETILSGLRSFATQYSNELPERPLGSQVDLHVSRSNPRLLQRNENVVLWAASRTSCSSLRGAPHRALRVVAISFKHSLTDRGLHVAELNVRVYSDCLQTPSRHA